METKSKNNLSKPNISTEITLTALNAIQKSYTNKQKFISAATIQEGSVAQIVAENIHQEILEYQSKLPDNEDVAMCVVQFNQSMLIKVDSIGYIGYNLIRFGGKNSDGKPIEVVQHVSQVNFLLTIVPKPVVSAPKRKIGFVQE